MLGAGGKAHLPFLQGVTWLVCVCFAAEIFEYPLDFQEIAESIYFRVPIVQQCIHETLLFFAEALRGKKEVDFFFNRLGILSLRGQEVIMNFFDDCVLQVDATGNMLPALLGVSLHASGAPCSALK